MKIGLQAPDFQFYFVTNAEIQANCNNVQSGRIGHTRNAPFTAQAYPHLPFQQLIDTHQVATVLHQNEGQ